MVPVLTVQQHHGSCLVDFLRSGAADQQKNADGKEENKKEVELHAALEGWELQTRWENVIIHVVLG